MTTPYTEDHRTLLREAIQAKITGNNRSMSKQPKFRAILLKDNELLQECLQIIEEWATAKPK